MKSEKNNAKFKYELKKRVYIYSIKIIKLIDFLNKRDPVIQVIARQLLRSATSIGANIVEAQSGRTRRDFANFLCYGLKSANETKFWLGLLRDSKKVEDTKVNPPLKETDELARILGSSILTLKRKRKF
jgi:four helix bundle protein